jgi:nicotinate-nucleotide adenylyltransferase
MEDAPAAAPEKLGVLGGTFDPIHRGHLAMARAALEERGLDRVLLVPSAVPPHKDEPGAAALERLAMVRLAAAGDPRLAPCDLEVRRGGTSYTYLTLEELRRRHPRAELFFIIGEDSIAELPRWRNAPRILELAEILTLPREGRSGAFRPEDFPGVPPEILARCEANRLHMPLVPIASRDIRRAIRDGRDISKDVPEAVAEYIRSKGLYGADAMSSE